MHSLQHSSLSSTALNFRSLRALRKRRQLTSDAAPNSILSAPDIHDLPTGDGNVCITAYRGRPCPLSVLELPLELSLNGVDAQGEITTSSLLYSLYDEDWFRLHRIHPLGGPTGGNTLLHVYLIDNRLLLDLGGLACRFSLGGSTAPVIVPASVTDCQGARACGVGWGAIACRAPNVAASHLKDGILDVPVHVSLNGQEFSPNNRKYRYYNAASWTLRSLTPHGGPLQGGTTVEVTGNFVALSLGDVRCSFGVLNVEVNATIVDSAASLLRCVSPQHWRLRGTGLPFTDAVAQPVEIRLTLNGQDYISATPEEEHRVRFRFYSLGSRQGVELRQLRPHGGPTAGGTRVVLCGSGFSNDVGALLCQFGSSQVIGTWLTPEHIACTAPAFNESYDAGRALELSSNGATDVQVSVTLNGQQDALTGGAQYTYYRPVTSVYVSKIYPLGGPRAGGTVVSLFGTGFRDLNHGLGLRCRFGVDVVNATLQNELHMVCKAPRYAQTNAAPTCSTFPQQLHISLNAQEWLPGREIPFEFQFYSE